MTEHFRRTIAELAGEFQRGLSPVSCVEQCLHNIHESNGKYHAMIFVKHDEALEAARQAEAELRHGRLRGLLHGVPVAVKDVIDVQGWPTSAGSKLFDGRTAVRDAACVTMLREAGAIIIGKTNLHELTAGGFDNPWYGKVVNPLSSDRGTGGTSSGSAAAVALGYCAAAIGTDTGGSNRSTAAATGLVGFKPTNGVIDGAGVLPTAPTLDTVGPIASCVEDAWLLHAAMQGGSASELAPLDLSGIRIGLCPDLYASDVDPAVACAHEKWLKWAANSGAVVQVLKFPPADQVKTAGLTILSYEFARFYGRFVRAEPDRVGEAVHRFMAEGLAIGAETYEAALDFRNEARREFLAMMAEVDFLATPVAPGLAPRLVDEMTEVGSSLVPYGLAGGSFRRWANVFGVPALALPLATEGGLPASIQISALPHMDRALFSACAALSRMGAASK